MIRTWSVLGVAATMLVVSRLSGQTTPPAQDGVQLFVVVEQVADTTVVYPALKRWGVTVLSRYARMLTLSAPSAYMVLPGHAPFFVLDSIKAITRPDNTSPISYAEFNRTVRLDVADSTTEMFSATWGLDSLRVKRAWAMGDSGQGVIVGVMDTGLHEIHPEFAGRFVGGASFANRTGVDSSFGAWRPPDNVCKDHGTHVSATAVGKTVGVAPGAELLFARVFDTQGGCFAWISAIVQGFSWLSDHGADVVNSSISGSFYGAYEAALWQRPQTIMVAAAGNSSPYVNFPASSAYGIGAASLAANLRTMSYSAVGPENDFAAPGQAIYSAYLERGYAVKSGTSMASPHLAGLVALWISGRGYTPIDTIIANLAAVSYDVPPAGFDNHAGWGMPRADRVAARAMGISEQPTTLAGPIRLSAGTTVQSGCLKLVAPVEWRATGAPAWLTLQVRGDSLCYTTTGTVPVAATDTVRLVVVP